MEVVEMSKINQLYYDEVQVGDDVTPLIKGPMTTSHIMRWSSAMENWHRIHYDRQFATEHDGLPTVLINGSWKQQIMCQLIKDWVGEEGWLWKISFQHRAMNIPGETLTTWGKITSKYEADGLGFVECDIGMKNQEGIEACPGKSTAVLPIRGGKSIPYPFIPPKA